MSIPQKVTHRIHGLDTLRASAIILVYLAHYGFVINRSFFDIGWIGVDLFFVLSGYLIGQQIFTDIAHKRNFSTRSFIMRRLLRTLPNYLVVLALYSLVAGFREKPVLLPIWKFLTFTFNFGLTTGVAFSHAWSLCIEEQFYLILPLLAIYIYLKKSLKFALSLIIGVLALGILLRMGFWLYCSNGNLYFNAPSDLNHFNYKSYYTWVYYFTFCRLDSLIMGVSLALIRNFYSQTWYKITAKGNLTLVIGTSLLLITGIFLNDDRQYAFFQNVVGYPMLAISFGLLVISALSPNSLLHKSKIFGAELVAKLSFAIYLIQKPVDHMVANFLEQHNIVAKTSSWMFACTAISSLVCGWILYQLVESPFLKLRDKFYKRPRL